jgi:hypothetical protein
MIKCFNTVRSIWVVIAEAYRTILFAEYQSLLSDMIKQKNDIDIIGQKGGESEAIWSDHMACRTEVEPIRIGGN